MGSKVLRSIYLDITQVERIKKLSEITKVPQAVYVREGVDCHNQIIKVRIAIARIN